MNREELIRLVTELAEMEKRATPGEWLVDPFRARIVVPDSDAPICEMLWPTKLRSESETEANAEFICEFRNRFAALHRAIMEGGG